MAGYTTNPGLAETLGGLAQTFMGDPSRKMRAAQLRAQAGKFNQERLASIQDMEIKQAEEARAKKQALGLANQSKRLADAFALRPGDVEAIVEAQRPTPNFVGPGAPEEDLYTPQEINSELAQILGSGVQYKDFNKNALESLKGRNIVNAPDWRTGMSASNGASGSNLNTVTQDQAILNDKQAHAIELQRQGASQAEALAIVNGGQTRLTNTSKTEDGARLDPIDPDKILTPNHQKLSGVTQDSANTTSGEISKRDSDEIINQNNAKPVTGTAVMNWVGPDGTGGTSGDGKTDLITGELLPANSRVFKATTTGNTGDATGIGTPTQQGKRAQQLAALTSLEDMVSAEIGKIAADPSIVGVAGIAQNFTQGLLDSMSGLGGVQRSTQDIIADVAGNENFSPQLREKLLKGFNDDLASMNTRFDMMAYLAAESIAGQSGRGLSDKDFVNFRRALGDPRSFFSGSKTVAARLKSFQSMISRKRKELGSLGGPRPDGESKRLRYNPETGELE